MTPSMPISFINLATVQRAIVAIGSAIGPSDNGDAFSAHLVPDFAHAIDLEVLFKDPFNLGLEFCVTLGAIR